MNIFTTIWEKTKQAGRWVKTKAKQLLIWVGIIGVATASTLVVQDLTRNEVSLDKLTQKYEQSIEIKDKYQLDNNSLKMKNIKNAELDKYKGEPKDEIEVVIGDKDSVDFAPNIKIKRWNEVSFKIKPNLTGVATKDKDLIFEGNKILFKTPKIDFEIYEYTEGAGGYKYIWYLNEKPDTNIIEFQIESEGLDFFYQPPLNLEEAENPNVDYCTETDCYKDGEIVLHRPEDIVGSYVIYHKTKGGLNDINGKEYKAGKVGHIYKPHIYDSDGKECWGDLHIENGIYSIKIPQDFLNNAVYPIKSNDTFGYEQTTGSSQSVNGRLCGSKFAGAAGTVTRIDSYNPGSSNTTLAHFGIYEASGETLISNGQSNSFSGTTNWSNADFSTDPTITAQDYILAAKSNQTGPSTPYIYYASGDSGQGYTETDYDAYGGTLPDSYPTYTGSTRKYCIYATYTPGGGEEEEERRFFIFD